MFGEICRKIHPNLLSGKCPWCGEIILPSELKVSRLGLVLFCDVPVAPAVAENGGDVQLIIPRWPDPVTVLVRVPPRSQHGAIIRLRGVGDIPSDGGSPGDVWVKVRVQW
jgi:DnaJ-class molecular chaperone